MEPPSDLPTMPASPDHEDSKHPITSPPSQSNSTEKSQLVLDDKPEKNASSKSSSSSSTSTSPCCPSVNRSLLPIKGFYLFFLGALGSLAPFIAILLKQYGISPQQIGVIFGLRPIIGFISGPLWGALADKFKRRRMLLLISLGFWMAAFIALAFIPQPKRRGTCPDKFEPSRVAFQPVPSPKRVYTEAEDILYNNVTDANVTAEQLYMLRENYGWIYQPEDLSRVFLMFLLLILLGEFVQSPTTALSDASTLEILGPGNIDAYGHQRAWGSLGWAITSVSVGTLVSMTRRTEVVCSIPLHFSDYISYVYVFSAFMFFAFLCASFIPFPNESKKSKKTELTKEEDAEFSVLGIFQIFCNLHYGSWLITTFFVGVFNGVIWGFLNWHLDNLGANELLIGVSNVIKCMCEFCMFFLVHRVSELVGHMGLMYACLVSYALMFAGYASLVNPWYVLLLEVVHGCSFSSVWVSLTAYTTLAVPSHTLATVQGLLHGVYFGLGNGMGHLVGGLLIGSFGVPVVYYSMSVVSIITALFLFTAQKCSTKPDGPYQSFDNR